MIYSASRRTDMPAFHPDAIVQRVRRSRKLEGLVLWTKDIRNLAFHPDLSRVIAGVPTVVQYTVTGLAGTAWEPGTAPLENQLSALKEVAHALPNGAICWRFDPIMPGAGLAERFRTIKAGLESVLGTLDHVTVSFPDPYRKAVSRSLAAGLEWPVVNPEEKRRILAMMVDAFTHGGDASDSPPVRLCCEPELLAVPGVGMAKCIDGDLFRCLYGLPLGDLPKDGGQRKHCGCSQSTDIGSYDMRCGHGCRYCYANPEG